MKKSPIAIVGISYVLISAALAADTAEKIASPETAAITHQTAEYTKAYNAGGFKLSGGRPSCGNHTVHGHRCYNRDSANSQS